MLNIRTEQGENFLFDTHKGQLLLNGQPWEWDLHALSDTHFHVLFQNRSFNLEVVQLDHAKKEAVIRINGKDISLKGQDEMDLLLEKMGMSANKQPALDQIKAPMPGLILQVMVAAGEEVKAGQPLVILEAMKMENVIKSPRDGRVRELKAIKGNTVEKGAVLIQFDNA